LSHHLPLAAPAAKALDEWTKKIEASTNGGVKFTIYPSETLAKGREAYSATVGGICDVAFVNLVYESSKWGLNGVINQPTLLVPTDERGTKIWNKLLEKYPQMVNEFAGVKVLSNVVGMTTSIHTKAPVRVPADIKGMKMAAMGDSLVILRTAGASPVSMPAGDWYMSAEKGVIQGCMAPVGVVTDRGIQEVLKNHIDLGIGQGGNVVIINLARWNSFPPDIKAKFEELTSWLNNAVRTANEQLEAEGWRKCASQSIVKPTAAELKLWLACTEPTAEAWIKQNASKGPSQEIFNYVKQLIAETK
jgi:TRAP-type C4-dicarboxylate transport system substrate-binding protein